MRKIPIPFVAVLLLLAAATVLAGCAGAAAAPSGVVSLESTSPDESATPSASVDPEAAMLAFTACMREQGIDLPDPGSGEPTVIRVGGDGFDPEEFEAANEACRHHLRGVISEEGPQLTPEQEDALLAFAQCMREHGVDMPDPGDGGFVAPVDGDGPTAGAFPDPNDPEFRKAEEACRHHMGDALPDRVGPGGPGGAEGAMPGLPVGGDDQ